ncbi:MAG TPA: hypothetical protein VFJ13_05740, partial [Paracoccaceae bacterium]|nr:hypothetical protein [Paracoccaceae bacterium]
MADESKAAAAAGADETAKGAAAQAAPSDSGGAPPAKGGEAAPPKDDGKAGTILTDGGDADEGKAAAPADWPEDWRQRLAGDDKKALKRLERLGSPKDVMTAYRALERKVSSGELKTGLKEDATPEEVASWRRENGIPEKPEDYDTTLPDGLVIGEDDKPLVGEFLTAMHAKNAHPETVKAALAAYYRIAETQQAAQIEADRGFRREAEDALRAEWGPEYRPNVNAMGNFLDGAPAGLKERLLGARLADGKLLG